MSETLRGAPVAARRRRLSLLVGVAVWLAAVSYLLPFAFLGWIPHDAGLLGQAAERAMEGEIPHVDFDDPYTGGLTWLHAAAFEVFGVRLPAIRIVLLLAAVGFAAALWGVARRFAGPFLAAAVTALAVVWSVPNYFESVPSWYNLFGATVGLWALLRHRARPRAVYLVLAGVAVGLSILAKVTGLYFAAAALLVLVRREQSGPGKEPAPEPADPRPGRSWALLVSAGAIALTALLVALVGPQMRVAGASQAALLAIHFVLPGAAVGAFVAWAEWRNPTMVPVRERARRLARLVVPFAVGAGLVIVPFLGVYAAAGGLEDLYRGLFVLPRLRYRWASFPLPPLSTLVAVLPFAAILGWPERWSPPWARRPIWVVAAVVSALGAVVLAVAGGAPPVYRWVWAALRPMVPVVVLVGLWRLGPRVGWKSVPAVHLDRFAVLATLAFVSLIQFPYPYGVYFYYVAPLVVVATLAVAVDLPFFRRRLLFLWLVAGLAFGAIWLNHASARRVGIAWTPRQDDHLLDLPRGGLYVGDGEGRMYEDLVREIWRHVGPGAAIWASPDCPEVYFLSATRNPSRSFFDFFEGASQGSGIIPPELDSEGVRVVVINLAPSFSPPVEEAAIERLAERYPRHRTIGKFLVMW